MDNLNDTMIRHGTRFQLWLRVDPHDTPRICAQIYDSAEITSLNYWLEIVFSASIATFGLVLNSPAVIIGAMLISPLMGPIMATGLSLAAGDLYLAMKAVANLVASIALAIGLSAVFVWLLPFHSPTGEILSRIDPNLLDLGVALFSGLAGSVAVSRAGVAGGVTTLPGVAIAVALMPPLCAMGFGLGSGANMRIMGGAGLLFLTNLVAIVASAFVVFLLIGLNSPEIRAQMEQFRKGERLAERLAQSPFSKALSNGGQLRWRILVLVLLLGAIAVPLRTALLQVAGEAVARGAVQEVVKGLFPRGSLVSQQVEVGRKEVLVHLISTRAISERTLHEAEDQIASLSGRKAEISISSIASQSELAGLMQRLSTPPPARPAPKPVDPTLGELEADLMKRVTPIITSIWPSEAPIKDFTLSFRGSGIMVTVSYTASQALGPIPLNMLTKELEEKLATPTLTLNAERMPLISGPAKHSPPETTRR
jgi:uncharacterized hydrophobic protein (TIGR00271 family)